MADRSVLILGGGIGGLALAARLRRSLGRGSTVTLVERGPELVFAPSLPWVMIGARRAARIRRPLDRLLPHGVDRVQGEVRSLDPARRQADVDGRTLAADHLVIALGADLAPGAVPGLVEGGHSLYTLVGAEGLREALGSLRRGRIVLLTAAPGYKCPAAPYEAAMLFEWACRRRGVRQDVTIDLYAAEPAPMGVAGLEVSAAVRTLVESKGIRYHPDHAIARVDAGRRLLEFKNGAGAEFDLLAYVPPHRAPEAVRRAGLVDESGWVPADRHTLETRFENVFAIGDVATIPLSIGKPLPKAGVFAHRQAHAVAGTLRGRITGSGDAGRFDGHGECYIETGDGRAALGRGNFYAEPRPTVAMRPPGRLWHAGKVLLEKQWLYGWF